MSLITLYIIFALATGIAAWYELFWPLMSQARSFGIRNDITRSPWLSSFVYVCITTLVAPAIILAVLVPSMGVRFRTTMQETLFKE